MAGEPVVHIGENSPEHVAYQLFRHIASVEGKQLAQAHASAANREWILRTYRQCIEAVTMRGQMDDILR